MVTRETSRAGAPNPRNTPIGRRRRAYELADEIEKMIRSGEYAVGTRLPSEKQLTQRFGVGRPAVREALFMLKFSGLVEISSGSRALVTAPKPEFLVDQLAAVGKTLAAGRNAQQNLEQTRMIFESGLAWLAAQVATEDGIQRLKAALDANRAAIGDTAEFVRTDVRFHYELMCICRNPIFEAVHNVLVDWLIDQRTTTINMPDADRFSVRDHTAIYEAVAAGNPARAYHAMASHLRLISQLYAEAARIANTTLRQVTHDVAEHADEASHEIWRASFSGLRAEKAGDSTPQNHERNPGKREAVSDD